MMCSITKLGISSTHILGILLSVVVTVSGLTAEPCSVDVQHSGITRPANKGDCVTFVCTALNDDGEDAVVEWRAQTGLIMSEFRPQPQGKYMYKTSHELNVGGITNRNVHRFTLQANVSADPKAYTCQCGTASATTSLIVTDELGDCSGVTGTIGNKTTFKYHEPLCLKNDSVHQVSCVDDLFNSDGNTIQINVTVPNMCLAVPLLQDESSSSCAAIKTLPTTSVKLNVVHHFTIKGSCLGSVLVVLKPSSNIPHDRKLARVELDCGALSGQSRYEPSAIIIGFFVLAIIMDLTIP